MALSLALKRGMALLAPRSSSDSFYRPDGEFVKAPEGHLFPKVDPAVDGEDCDHECASCEVQYPRNFKVDETRKLYGHAKPWSTHVLVATGKSDWTRNATDEKNSVVGAIKSSHVEPSNGKLMLSASNMPVPESALSQPTHNRPTTVLILPSFTLIEDVTPSSIHELIKHHISPASTNTTPLHASSPSHQHAFLSNDQITQASTPPAHSPAPSRITSPFKTRPCSHKYLILMCSHRTHDARCGQSAPLLRREFERHLRPRGLYRDLNDERPGGVGIYFVSHTGGHKFSANVIVYRRAEEGNGEAGGGMGEASQCIWLARVRPEDCEGIVKFTVLQGKVVKPERQLRGGFDREKGLVSW